MSITLLYLFSYFPDNISIMCCGFNIVYNNKSIITIIIYSCQSEHVNISANMMHVCMYVFIYLFSV